MTNANTAPRRTSRAAVIWLAVTAGLLLLIGANAHLVFMAVSTQPGCVAHVRAGEGDAARGTLGAAQSACGPPNATGHRATKGGAG